MKTHLALTESLITAGFTEDLKFVTAFPPPSFFWGGGGILFCF